MDQYNPEIFKNREKGGQKLAECLQELDLQDLIVLAIPSGGVPVGKKVAENLDAPFDLLIVRKIKHPLNPEAGIGSVTANGEFIFNEKAIATLTWEEKKLERLAEKTYKEVEEREKKFRGDKPQPDLNDKTVILVDDGLASGFTMLAAVESVKNKNPKKIIVAVPTASEGAVELIRKKVDQVISIYTHPKNRLFAVASSYRHWHDLTDDEVLKILAE